MATSSSYAGISSAAESPTRSFRSRTAKRRWTSYFAAVYSPDRPPEADLLVLLDINMPGIDGIEVLRQIKSNPTTRRTPVLMLTSSENPREIDRCYEYGCNSYITKSVDAAAFIEAVRENLP